MTTKEGKRGIRWTLMDVLEDLDFADDIVLLASRYVDIQDKTDAMAEKAKGIGLDVNIEKTKVLGCTLESPSLYSSMEKT